MKVRIVMAGFLLYVTAFLQSGPLTDFRPFGIRMILPLAMAVMTGLLRGRGESILMGFLYGMVMDMLMGRTLGVYALLYAIVAGSISLVNEKLYRDKWLLQVVFSALAALFTETLYFLFLFLLRGYGEFDTIFIQTILPLSLLNGLLVLPLYGPLRAVYTKLDKLDRKRNRLGTS